jgi:hypothetical protein
MSVLGRAKDIYRADRAVRGAHVNSDNYGKQAPLGQNLEFGMLKPQGTTAPCLPRSPQTLSSSHLRPS